MRQQKIMFQKKKQDKTLEELCRVEESNLSKRVQGTDHKDAQ